MRTFLLFIGSVLYPVVMVIISPVFLTLYLLYGLMLVGQYIAFLCQHVLSALADLKLPLLHLPEKKSLAFRPKAVRLH